MTIGEINARMMWRVYRFTLFPPWMVRTQKYLVGEQMKDEAMIRAMRKGLVK